jgi:hypothetical protein
MKLSIYIKNDLDREWRQGLKNKDLCRSGKGLAYNVESLPDKPGMESRIDDLSVQKLLPFGDRLKLYL